MYVSMNFFTHANNLKLSKNGIVNIYFQISPLVFRCRSNLVWGHSYLCYDLNLETIAMTVCV